MNLSMSSFLGGHLNDSIDSTANRVSVPNPIWSSTENIRRTFQSEYAWMLDVLRSIVLGHCPIHVGYG